ncbi:membrane protein, putative [Oceaniovalibus guishaninsula JLT2003]|uniref:Membrane protein, putative n=1 Tax=Oceaniovalibus guishaninsula JLT2003 TaxID=1231392 RepID=K2GKJ1_9RHOB|nr:urate hydroxylase PuuD [Oceaniovalibus guishaninsula]EKE43276.1 membrane protein, putative [Oceaniovalibus guishaninsula JLT2003]
MYDVAILWDWFAFAVRWLHVITAIAWIGSSFYFVALDLGLNRNIKGPADGEEWQVHGGGFYHIQKYLVAPETMPEHLTWFKWESYATWLSGAALLMIVYWAGAELFLIDPEKADLALWQAILISAGFIAVGWLGYDYLCRSPLREYPTAVMLVLFLGIVVVSWALNHIFTGRAALLHLGAMTATIMTANVFFVIMPNQRIVVDDLKAGRKPDPKYGKIAKLRSTHNNYLTLPVLFLMLSNHYPLAFGTEYSWIIAALVFLIGVSIRHYFNTMHMRQKVPTWTWAVTAVLFISLAWLSTANTWDGDFGALEAKPLTPHEQEYAAAAGFADAADVVMGRCSMCHAREPVWEGVRWAPKGVYLETPADIAREARQIYLQAGVSHAMPPANITGMTDADRETIADWFQGVNEGRIAGLVR